MKIYIGIDNGTSGSLGIIKGDQSVFCKIPSKNGQDYTKKKKNVTRINVVGLHDLFADHVFASQDGAMALIERPFVNPKMFNASLSGVRAMEAIITFLEAHSIPFAWIDSKEWQSVLLPQGTKGTPELKKASMDIGCRLFPMHRALIEKHKDADGILIAEYCRRKY